MASSALYHRVHSNQEKSSQVSKWQFPRPSYKTLLSSFNRNNKEKPSPPSSSEKSDIYDRTKLQPADPKKTAAFPVQTSGCFKNNSSVLFSVGFISRDSNISVTDGSDSLPDKVLPKTILCCVCKEAVEETKVSQHLFFGPVKCLNCHVTCSNCSSFKSVSDDNVCKHTFFYPADPCEFLLQNSRNFFHDKRISETKGKTLIENYTRILNTSPVFDKLPWRLAIRALKRHKNSGSNSWKGVPTTSKCSQESKANKTVSSVIASTITHGEKIDEHVLSQNYDFGALDQATEYRYIDLAPKAINGTMQPVQQSEFIDNVVSASNSNSVPVALQNSESLRKVENKRRGSDSSVNLPSDQVQPSQESEYEKNIVKRKKLDTESLVDIPSDGYYLIMTKAIEECPMCYTVICPSRFRVNVASFLVTTVCIGCGLIIYFAVSPNVSILTERTSLSIGRKRHPKKKGKRCKVSTEAVKAKAYFAK